MIAIAAKDLRVMWRTRYELALTVLAPLVLLALAAFIFEPTGRDLPIAYLAPAGSPAAQRLEAALTSRAGVPLYLRVVSRDASEAERLLASGRVMAVITVPEDFDERLPGGATVDVRTYNVMADAQKNTRLSIARGVQRFNEGEAGGVPVAGAVDPASPIPSRSGWFAGGMVVYALMFGGFLTGGIAAAREWEEGTVDVLRGTPMTGWRVGAGKVMAGSVAALGVAAVAGATGMLATDFRVRGDALAVAVLAVATSVFTASVGVLLGTLARQYYLMMPLSGILAVVLWFVGGGFSDLTLAQGTFLVTLSGWLPTSYAFGGLAVLARGGGWPEVAPFLAVVTASAATGTLLATAAVHASFRPRRHRCAARPSVP